MGKFDYKAEDFESPELECDLIMKGGITSGVVFPGTITELATKYRYRNLGGTSAGAIAAGFAAAAEYGRQTGAGGFEEIAKLPDELGSKLLSLFKPDDEHRNFFNVFIILLRDKCLCSKILSGIFELYKGYWCLALAGVVTALLFFFLGLNSLGIFILALLFSLLGVVVFPVVNLIKRLPETMFGICRGEVLTEWLDNKIETIAGRSTSEINDEAPLTFGTLEEKGINLKMMTTNISQGRPFQLPMKTRKYKYDPSEFKKLFPGRILKHMCSHSEPDEDEPLYRSFPNEKDLPVVVAIRMSLSFPLLLSAIPLYTRDFSHTKEPGEQEKLRRCWFSDGGISSNFPIHFFDKILPERPTFGITLDGYKESRQGKDIPSKGNRIYLPVEAGGGMTLPVRDIDSVFKFLGSIVGTAMSWQDRLQSILPGYRERIAHVALSSDEGGLNLAMTKEKIEALACYGKLAGEELNNAYANEEVEGFSFDEHKWRRLLVALARLEETTKDFSVSYSGGYKNFIDTYSPIAKSYKNGSSKKFHDELVTFSKALNEVMKDTDITIGNRKIPKPKTDMRIVPKMDGEEPS